MRKMEEGGATLMVPPQTGSRKVEVFYNPAMREQRDLTMAALRAWGEGRRDLRMCDALAGTGVRSIRALKETGRIGHAVVNDKNPKAHELIRKNLRLNRVPGPRAEACLADANELFLGNRGGFDYVDIDPFGSPIEFIFNAGYALKTRSILGLTATDTGALCGSFPRTCKTRYGIMAVKTDFFKEVGIRVLITSAMTELARHDLALSPLYCHANHYFRVLADVRRSSSSITRNAGSIRLVSYCPSCLWRSVGVEKACPCCGSRTAVMGPLWTGPIKESGFCLSMLRTMEGGSKEIETAAKELDEPFYYDLHRLFRATKSHPKKLSEVMEALKSTGHEASRTHLSPTGIRTGASHREVLASLRR